MSKETKISVAKCRFEAELKNNEIEILKLIAKTETLRSNIRTLEKLENDEAFS